MASPTVFTVNAEHPDPAVIAQAARLVCDGGLVAFPTETVYGVAADATNPKAIARLNRVKGRPPEKPYSLHLCRAEQVTEWMSDVPALANQLMRQFWPGPLTIVMPVRALSVTMYVSAADRAAQSGESLGFRLPNHPVAQAFLCSCNRPIVAPSANRSGQPPPTDGREVLAALGEEVDGVLDAGPTAFGRESTVVSVAGNKVSILREGAIAAQAIRDALHP